MTDLIHENVRSYPCPPAIEPVAEQIGPMVEAWVSDLGITPQPGGFYGCWRTLDLDVQIKGAPGTRHC